MRRPIFDPLLLVALALVGTGTADAQRVGFADSDAVRLYYEIYGERASDEALPVVLVAGLGSSTWLWERQVTDLAEYFVTVVFDNRGSGRSEAPAGPYSVSMMAADVASLLDAIDVERAHVVGASLGGLIAQEFALQYPDRVGRLVLISTTAGGASHESMSAETAGRFMATHEDPEELIRIRLPLAFSEGYLSDEAVVQHLIGQRLDRPQDPAAYRAQAIAGATFDAAGRVGDIRAATLIAQATDDLLVPVANAYRLADSIPNAALRLYDGLGHQFFVEIPDTFNRDLVAFLKGLHLVEAD